MGMEQSPLEENIMTDKTELKTDERGYDTWDKPNFRGLPETLEADLQEMKGEKK